MITNSNNAHSNMLMQQVRANDVKNPRVLAALTAITREQFVDQQQISLAYADMQLPIGYEQTMLSPTLEGRLLESLDVKAGETVLEVGTGTGYFTALLATLAKQVISVELLPELSEQAQHRIEKLDINNATFEIGDASKGWPVAERVDVIVISAALTEVPDDYLQIMAVGGRMLAVVGKKPAMSVQLIERTGEWEWRTSNLFETVITEMVNAEPKPAFIF